MAKCFEKSGKLEGKNMLKKINKALRSIVLIIGSILLIAELTKDKAETKKRSRHGYQSEEFDDIW